jgi:hypothetical protein
LQLNKWVHEIISFLFARRVDSEIAALKRQRTLAGKWPRPDSDPRSNGKFGKNLARWSSQFVAIASRRFEFYKAVSFSSAGTETLSVVAMCHQQRRLLTPRRGDACDQEGGGTRIPLGLDLIYGIDGHPFI